MGTGLIVSARESIQKGGKIKFFSAFSLRNLSLEFDLFRAIGDAWHAKRYLAYLNERHTLHSIADSNQRKRESLLESLLDTADDKCFQVNRGRNCETVNVKVV